MFLHKGATCTYDKTEIEKKFLQPGKWGGVGKDIEIRVIINPLIPMSDQNRISPDDINTISSRQMMRIKKKKKLGDY